MPGATYNRLAEIAAERYDYVTTADAEALGLDPHRLYEMARRGQLEHPTTAVYRVPLIPATPLDPYMQATLWPRNTDAVISHASALGLYELGDVNPAKIHITVPRAHRPRRKVPTLYVLHREDLRPEGNSPPMRAYRSSPRPGRSAKRTRRTSARPCSGRRSRMGAGAVC